MGPLPAVVTVEALDRDPHPVLAELRAVAPVAWVPALDGWLVTRRDLALAVMRDPATFTVDDARFSTGRVVGPSMLTLDGAAHARHRAPFAPPLRLAAVRERFTGVVEEEADRLVGVIEADGRAELRRAVAGPLAAAVVTAALGLERAGVAEVLGWYEAIVAAVTELTAGGALTAAGRDAFAALREAVLPALDRDVAASLVAAAGGVGGLHREEVVSNAAVLLFGGIETTEGMILNATALLLAHPEQAALVREHPALLRDAVEESLRLEPAAATIDRYATRDVALAGAAIGRGDLVTVSIAAANRDPATFADPDRFDVRRREMRLHAAFAAGPHVCIGMHLARLEAHTALARLLRLPGLRLDPDRPHEVRGLVFRKPPALHVRWDAPGGG